MNHCSCRALNLAIMERLKKISHDPLHSPPWRHSLEDNGVNVATLTFSFYKGVQSLTFFSTSITFSDWFWKRYPTVMSVLHIQSGCASLKSWKIDCGLSLRSCSCKMYKFHLIFNISSFLFHWVFFFPSKKGKLWALNVSVPTSCPSHSVFQASDFRYEFAGYGT